MILPTHNPSSTTECLEICRQALADGNGLQVLGGKTRAVLGEAPQLSMRHLNSVRFLHPQDMVIGVDAGLPFADLWDILEAKDMALPVNAWYERATLGGMVAANDFGADRMFGGGIRDHLIGIEYIDGRGELVKAGGQVVKNVTGYDVARMMIGSLGGFGCITALNFRLVPAKTGPMVGFLTSETLEPLARMQQLAEARTPLDWVEVRGRRGCWQCAFGYSGNPARRAALQLRLKNQLGGDWQFLHEGGLPTEWLWAKARSRHAGFLNSLPNSLGPDPWHLFLTAPASEWTSHGFLQDTVANGGYWVLHPFGGDGHWFLPREGDFRTCWEPWQPFFGPEARVGSCLEMVQVPEPVATSRQRYLPLPLEYPLACELKRHLDPNSLFHAPFYQMQKHVRGKGDGH